MTLAYGVQWMLWPSQTTVQWLPLQVSVDILSSERPLTEHRERWHQVVESHRQKSYSFPSTESTLHWSSWVSFLASRLTGQEAIPSVWNRQWGSGHLGTT